MSEKYGFLRKFLPPHPEFDGTKRNQFFPIDHQHFEKIAEAEKKLKLKFPSELLQFYEEIGFGFLCVPHNIVHGYEINEINLFLAPNIVAGLYKSYDPKTWPEDPILPVEADGYYMSGETYEFLQPGDLPFFEISNGSQFLVLRPNSDNPNAVWTDMGNKVENSFERFVWRLYYESPTFYDAIYEAAYKKSLEENN